MATRLDDGRCYRSPVDWKLFHAKQRGLFAPGSSSSRRTADRQWLNGWIQGKDGHNLGKYFNLRDC